MQTDLSDEFQRLWKLKDPARRGRLFENIFCQLLFKSGLTVLHDPPAAKPRQTDVLAEYAGDTFLFEMKWQKRKLDIDAIAQIVDRLGRVGRNTIGCICSMSGFTESLIKDIERRRSEREILLLNPFELYGLFCKRLDIGDLLDRKRRSLNSEGVAWFFGNEGQDSKRRYLEMPPAHESLDAGAALCTKLDSQHLTDLIFARTPLIFDEFVQAFNLRIRMEAASVEELRDIFLSAENYLGLEGTGSFGIRQRSSGWYGLGSDNFLNQIARYRQRYKDYRGEIHHSEELAFFDELHGGGIFLLTARQSMTRPGWIHSGEVIVRLRGLPVRTDLYEKLVRSMTTENVLFSPDHPLDVQRSRLRHDIRVEVTDVVSMIGSTQLKHDAISGVVLKNPFFRNGKELSKRLPAENFKVFAEPEFLMCALKDWLDRGDEVDYYILTGFDTVRIGQAVLLHPQCTWGNLVRRGRPAGSTDGFRKARVEWKDREQMLAKIKKASTRNKIQ